MAEEFKGPEILKTILQLVRYDIPPLIVGKSSIGKSYTIIELTKKWRLPNDILYIGSEKPENIEGLAKLIDSGYGQGENKEEILKFLKPYWFPNNTTITSQIKNGRDKFIEIGAEWTNQSIKFGYTYNCLYSMLIALMEVEFPEESNEIKVSLIDSAKSHISNNIEAQTLTNEVVFRRTPITKTQTETNVEGSLPPQQAGVDEIRDLCMYLCTLLGFGNYWLVLDEIDKVDKYSQDKYAPLLHIVREKTLKNWTLQPINDKKGLKIPFSLTNGYYNDVADSVDRQIEAGLPLLDTRVIGIGNASKEIEEALFRRFVQIIMEDTMSLYEPDINASRVKKCVKDNFADFNLMDVSLMKKIGFLDDVNLAWQYSVLPKIFNQPDKPNNYFYVDFMRYYNKLKERYPNRKDQENRMMTGELLDKTSIGKLFVCCFTGGGKAGNDEDLLKNFMNFLYCLVKEEWIDETKSTSTIGSLSEEGVEDSPIDKKRKLLIKQYEQDKDLFWDKLKLSITKSFNKNIEGKGSINVAGVQRWMSNQVLLIRASNEDGKGNYNQLPGIGEKLLPFVYPILLELITMTKEVDTDLYDSLMLQLNKGFDEMLNKDDTSPLDNIKFDAEASTNALQTLFGGYAEGSPEGFYHEGLAFRTYMNKYFLGDLKLFLKYELSPENFTDLISEPYYENISYFFQLIQVQAKLQQIYDNAKSKGKINANLKNLAKMAELEK